MVEYPIKFDKCPNCGSTNRLIQGEVDKSIEDGDLKPETKIPILATRALLYNPDVAPRVYGFTKEVPVILAYFDVCSDCGTLYCVAAEKGMATIEMQSGGKKPYGINQ